MKRGAGYKNTWNPYTETLPQEQLDAIEFAYFKEYLAYAKTHSAMYREKLKDINVGDIETMEDVRKIPFTYKDELRAQQEKSQKTFLTAHSLALPLLK